MSRKRETLILWLYGFKNNGAELEMEQKLKKKIDSYRKENNCTYIFLEYKIQLELFLKKCLQKSYVFVIHNPRRPDQVNKNNFLT